LRVLIVRRHAVFLVENSTQKTGRQQSTCMDTIGPGPKQKLSENIVSWRARIARIHSPKTSLLDQDSLIFTHCIDFQMRGGEMRHPITARSGRGI
jgi:hypothetical protein